ncbi:hypothetical protein PInf_010142 [Phytophthora infestans]|nr:hypothetical protein PInf_010142 [Phytophthora infestans]
MTESKSDMEHGETKHIGLDSGDALLANGPAAMHEFVATRLETFLGGELPQMEVRFTDLSVSADITVVEDDGSTSDLPTLWNTWSRLSVAKNVSVSGDLTYNGLSQAEIKKQLPQFLSYVPQHDKHFATLTVRETLEYAQEFCGGELKRRAGELLTQGKPDENAEAMAVAKAVTIVGDALLRGVSGGERKRVTTGEMEFGMKYMTLMDEISTGLDSAATFDIINTQRSIAHRYHKTVVIALLQPAPEVVALFDDLLILNAGEIMYHGPMSEVVPYFSGLGFETRIECPPGRDVADYLMDLEEESSSEEDDEAVDVDSDDDNEGVSGTSSEEDAAATNLGADVISNDSDADECDTEADQPRAAQTIVLTAEKHMKPMPEFHQSFHASAVTLLRRQMFIIGRNKPYIFGRALLVTVMGLLYATTFYQFDPTEIQVVMGIIFAGTLFLSLSQASQLPTFIAARDIFYKQRGANFYRTASYVVANSVSQLPLCITETLIFGTLVYWMCGFVSEILEFLLFLLVPFMTNFGLGSFFFVLTAAAPSINIATPISMASTLIFIIFAGFIVTEGQIPGFFIWLYWITPVSWTLRALAIIEYRSSVLDVCVYHDIDYCTTEGTTMGQYYLQLFDLKTEKIWIFYCVIYMAVFYVTCMTLGYLALEYKRYETPENVGVVTTKTEEDDAYRLATTPTSNVSKSLTASEVVMEVASRNSSFTPVTVAFKDLRYSVPKPSNPKESIELLKGISGFALPGQMTALMGASGAGKTTLMDVIAHRKTGGTISGQILLNGYEANEFIRRCTAYCEQMDIHSEASTIREALTSSAFLRQDSSVPDSTKRDVQVKK